MFVDAVRCGYDYIGVFFFGKPFFLIVQKKNGPNSYVFGTEKFALRKNSYREGVIRIITLSFCYEKL